MTACCTRKRREDGEPEYANIKRAMEGRSVRLSPSEASIVFWRLRNERHWGPEQISRHTGYSKSRISSALGLKPDAS